jgi:hypothetical protein
VHWHIAVRWSVAVRWGLVEGLGQAHAEARPAELGVMAVDEPHATAFALGHASAER